MYVQRRLLALVCSLLTSASLFAAPAAITFMEFDLKYNPQDGIKICEVQQGLTCLFCSGEILYGDSTIYGQLVANELQKWQQNVWYDSGVTPDENLKTAFARQGWTPVAKDAALTDDPEFLRLAALPVEDPTSLYSYHGLVVFHGDRFAELADFKTRFPGVLLMDSCFSNFRKDKSKFAKLFDDNEVLATLRPEWGLYEKGYSRELVKEIQDRFPGKKLVIKPLHSQQGRGVIIIKRKHLKDTLRYIFRGGGQLKQNPDRSYSHWARDKGGHFLVEAFYESVPVTVPYLDNREFDGTARVLVVMTRHLDQVQVKMVAGYWNIPEKSLDEKGTLNEKHKSSVWLDYYAEISPEDRQAMEQQLQQALPHLNDWL